VNVLGFTNLAQSEDSTLTQVASAINAVTFATDNFIDGEKMIFLVASTDAAGTNTVGTNTDVYLWTDSGTGTGHANVDANELVKIGVLKDFTQTDISHLSASSFVEHQALIG
jgi:hypothetical protein